MLAHPISSPPGIRAALDTMVPSEATLAVKPWAPESLMCGSLSHRGTVPHRPVAILMAPPFAIPLAEMDVPCPPCPTGP